MTTTTKDRSKIDPLLTYKFHIEIDGILVAGFSEASGLSIQTEYETVKEGGYNNGDYKLPVRTKFTDITLKRGVVETSALWDWFQQVVDGKFERKNGSIHLMDHVGNNKVSWDFFEAYPIKWDGPSFSASTSAVAVETFVLTHHKLSRKS